MKKIITLAMALVALTLNACTTNLPTTRLNVDMTDFAFTPNQYLIPAGQDITLHISHDGTVEHDFIIMKLGTEVGGHFNEDDLQNVYWQVKVQPGGEQTLTFTSPMESGTYQVVCGMPGHVEAGMIGTLTVVPASTSGN